MLMKTVPDTLEVETAVQVESGCLHSSVDAKLLDVLMHDLHVPCCWLARLMVAFTSQAQ